LSSLYHLDSNLNNKEVLVSVIIPIYNQNKLIENVIDYFFNSTYKNIKVIHKSNGGKRKAVSSGFMRSQGQYIILMDSDSIIDNNAISEFVKVFDSESSV